MSDRNTLNAVKMIKSQFKTTFFENYTDENNKAAIIKNFKTWQLRCERKISAAVHCKDHIISLRNLDPMHSTLKITNLTTNCCTHHNSFFWQFWCCNLGWGTSEINAVKLELQIK